MSAEAHATVPQHTLVLASQSPIRRTLLSNAGVEVLAVPARIDEDSVKSAMLADAQKPRDICDALAELKAQKVSRTYPAHFVLGSDQILVLNGRMFSKPETEADAYEQLLLLRNNTHELLSAAVIFYGGEPVFRHIGRARLTMRSFSDRFAKQYIENEGKTVLDTVGGYKIEERGAQLFSRLDGDYFSILGLPLLEVLDYLRARELLIQ